VTRAVAAALLLASCVAQPATAPEVSSLTVPLDGGRCGATWIGPRALVTAAHCVDGDGATVERGTRARVARRHPIRDLAELHTPDRRVERWAAVGTPRRGETVTVTTGRGESIPATVEWVDWHGHLGAQLAYPCRPGDSGAGVWDSDGALVCVVVSCGAQRARCELPRTVLE
jgi:hypothetical protein